MFADRSGKGRVQIFGPFGVFDAQDRPVRLEARSAAALCAYLAARWRGVGREETARTLWPGRDSEPSRAALRTAVYRVRQAFGEASIVDEGARLRLELGSDALDAVHLRRERQHANDAETTIAAASAEWAIVRHELLDAWEDEWVVPLRDDARLRANDCAQALARMYEERGELEHALDALDGVLSAVPHHAEALEHAMRLEHALHGRERALTRVVQAQASLGGEGGLALPGSIRRLERAIREGGVGFIPPPVALSDGADLALIGHMLENSLRQGDGTGLRLLAEQALSPVCARHPHRTLDLLRKALALSDGFGPDRCAVFVAAIVLAINLPANATVHELCDNLIAEFPSGSRMRGGALLAKGTAYINEMDLNLARKYTELAVADCTTEERRIVATAQLGMIDWREAKFQDALDRILPAIALLRDSDREDRHRNLAGLYAHAAIAHLALGNTDAAVRAGEETEALRKLAPIGEAAAAPVYGLALVVQGRVSEGVERLRYALRETHRARLTNAFVMTVEFAALALERLGRSALASAVLGAAGGLRHVEGIPRSQGDRFLIEEWSGLTTKPISLSPLRLQSPAALVEWVGEALQGALQPVAPSV